MRWTFFILAASFSVVGCHPAAEPSSVATQVGTWAATGPAKPSDRNLEPPDPQWREACFRGSAPLTNVPEIVRTTRIGGEIRVAVKNSGNSTLQYYSAGAKNVQLYQEVYEGGQWQWSEWDWCGTGKEIYEIAPHQTVELVVQFWDDDQRERMLARFSEKDTKRAGLVVLAAEPNEWHPAQ